MVIIATMYAVKRLEKETILEWYGRVARVAKNSLTKEEIIDLFVSLSYTYCKSLTDLKLMRACLMQVCEKTTLKANYVQLVTFNFDTWIYQKLQLHFGKRRLWKETNGILPTELIDYTMSWFKGRPA